MNIEEKKILEDIIALLLSIKISVERDKEQGYLGWHLKGFQGELFQKYLKKYKMKQL